MRSIVARADCKRSSEAGTTLLELIMVCAILVILSGSALPIARYTVIRQRETELRRDLREMRDAIDRYKDAADQNLIRVEVGTEGYPPDLTTLVMGVDLAGPASAPGSNIGTAAGALASQSGGLGQGGAGSINLAQAQGMAQAAGLSPAQTSAIGAMFGVQLGGASSTGATSSSSATGSNVAGAGAQSVTRHVRFLRKVPIDPMTGQAMWGMRSVQDDSDSTSWGGKDVFDVFSMSTGTALDGTKYSDW